VTITLGTACSGIGGAEIAAMLSGADFHPLFAVEHAAHQNAVLGLRHSYEALELDVYQTGRANLPTVDVYAAGFPCQPFSVAGRRGGSRDPRNLWPEIARHLEELGPRIAVLENVPALRNPHAAGAIPEDEGDEAEAVESGDAMPAYLGTVLGDLSDLGYRVAWDGRSAASIGAHHRRDRLWIIAWRDVEDFDPFSDDGRRLEAREIGRWDGTAWARQDLFEQQTITRWPRAGIVRGSVAFEVATASPGTSIGFVWPTPNAFDHVPFFGNRAEANGRHAMSLRHAAPDAMWPTSTAEDSEQAGSRREKDRTLTKAGRDAFLWPTVLTGSLPGSPRANSAQGGIDLLTEARSALYQTPTVGDATGGRSSKGAARPDDGGLRKQLAGALYPTPRASWGEYRTHGVSPSHGNGHGKLLQPTIKDALLYPPPRASEFKGTGPLGSRSHDHRLEHGYLDATAQEATSRSGLLNPRWVEALMGYPPGWTDLSRPNDAVLHPALVQRAWMGDALHIADLPETNPAYADYWLWHEVLGDLEIPLAPRQPQTKDRLISLGNAWVPQVAAPIFRRIAEVLGQ